MPREVKPLRSQSGTMVIGEVKAFDGLDNVNDPSVLKLSDFTRLQNVDHTDKSKLRRRSGTTLLSSGSYHSLWSDEETCLVVSGGNLCSVGEDYSLTILRSNVGDGRMSYVKGPLGIFYSNGSVIGEVRNGADFLLPSLYPDDPPWKSALFPSNLLEVFGSRLWLAVGSVVWYTDAIDYYKVDRRKNFLWFEKEVLMLRAVDEGIYIGDETGVYYVTQKTALTTGKNPTKMLRQKVSTIPPLRFSDMAVDSSLIKPELVGKAAIWLSDGVYIGLNNGDVLNFASGRYSVPEAFYGAPLLRQEYDRTLYIVTLT